MQDLKLSLIQTTLEWHDPAANRQHFASKIAAINDQSDLILLPEMFTTGFTMQSDEQAEAANSTTLQWMQQQAADTGAVITGSVATRNDGHCSNRLYWVTPNGDHQYYDKRHLFAMAGEHHSYQPGQQRLITELNGWRLCPQICYDLRFPVFSRNRGDYDILFYVANWPNKRRQHWIKLLQARAIENQCYCIGLNRIGSDDNGIDYAGDSLVVDPLGEVLLDAADHDTVKTITLDYQQLQETRTTLPFLQDGDRFTLL